VGTLIIVDVLLSTAFLLSSGALIGTLPRYVNGSEAQFDRHLVLLIAAVALSLLGMQCIGPYRMALTQAFGRRLEASLQARTMAAAFAQNGIPRLEDPESEDLISQARGVAMGQYTPALALWGLVEFLLLRLNVLASLVLIAVVSYWWLAGALVAVLQLVRVQARGPVSQGVESLLGTTNVLRRANYYLDLALTPAAAKETRVFGLADWITGRLRSFGLTSLEPVWAERRRISASIIPGLGFLLLIAVSLAVFLIGEATADGHISLADLAIAAPAIVNVVIGMLAFTHTDAWLEHGAAAIPAVLAFERGAAGESAEARVDPAGMPRHEIRFEGVSFTYPGRNDAVFHGLDLTIPAGRSLAIVGENGAGKTTLIKLLCRLYEPTGGCITVDGVDLRDLELPAWRRRLSVILQDFVRYELSARENITFSAIEHADDADAVTRAVERAGAASVVASLPRGLDTVLARHYEGGTDLSGGQWQRIALARALFGVEAGAQVLVLDEPTASLDVRAEAAIFDRFLDLTRGLTTILISHRFSTVRRADVICVIEHGQVIERGSHEELLAADGRYATMYRLQAAHFADVISTSQAMEADSVQ
jgi:ATP-binding cassette subfamily B protein